jgi:hypothetical protein
MTADGEAISMVVSAKLGSPLGEEPRHLPNFRSATRVY